MAIGFIPEHIVADLEEGKLKRTRRHQEITAERETYLSFIKKAHLIIEALRVGNAIAKVDP